MGNDHGKKWGKWKLGKTFLSSGGTNQQKIQKHDAKIKAQGQPLQSGQEEEDAEREDAKEPRGLCFSLSLALSRSLPRFCIVAIAFSDLISSRVWRR